MNITYYYADPTGNIALLVQSKTFLSEYPMVARLLMASEPEAEQTGFIEEPVGAGYIRLHMAGGEFCGNSLLSAAALHLLKVQKDEGMVKTEIYGVPGLLEARLKRTDHRTYQGSIEIPQPLSMEERQFTLEEQEFRLPLVEMPGISHVLFFGEPFPEAEKAVQHWGNELGAAALGIMFISKEKGTLTPLVYAPAADTLCWENSCASGTAAAAAWLARDEKKLQRFDFEEPGGTLSAEACKGVLRCIGKVYLEKRILDI